MTRIWVALGIVAAILALAFTEFKLTTDTSKKILNIIEETEISAKSNSNESEALCGDIRKLWDGKKRVLAMFLSHTEIDKIDISVENLIRYCEQEQYETLYIECGTLKNHMTSLRDSEAITFNNLF